MKLNKGIQRRLVVYFSIVTLLLTFVTVAMTLSVGKTNWPNPDGKVSIGRVTTNTSHWALTPEADSLAYAVACNENEEVTVKGVPTELFVYGVGEDFQIPEHWGFKASYAMKITSYCLSIMMIICFICILVNIFKGFRNGKYFSRMQVILLRWGALFSFLLFIANELCEKFRMEAISLLYQGSSDVGLAVAIQIQTQDLLIPFLLLILAEIINIALGLNEEESMTI